LFRIFHYLPGFIGVLVISDSLRKCYLSEYPGLAGRIKVARDGAFEQDRVPTRAVSSGGFLVGYVGSLYEGRGIEVVLETAVRCPWASFEIVGHREGDRDSNEYLFRAPPNVSFRDFVDPSLVAGTLQEFDVLLAPYQESTRDRAGNDTTRWMSPLKIFEYMASGVPIVASDLPALREVLRHGENSLLVSPSDSKAWARALNTMRDNAALREKLSRAAIQEIKDSLSWNRRMKDVVEWATQIRPIGAK
jgi:glycosyltransferase involved in cell wall biosynthesis